MTISKHNSLFQGFFQSTILFSGNFDFIIGIVIITHIIVEYLEYFCGNFSKFPKLDLLLSNRVSGKPGRLRWYSKASLFRNDQNYFEWNC